MKSTTEIANTVLLEVVATEVDMLQQACRQQKRSKCERRRASMHTASVYRLQEKRSVGSRRPTHTQQLWLPHKCWWRCRWSSSRRSMRVQMHVPLLLRKHGLVQSRPSCSRQRGSSCRLVGAVRISDKSVLCTLFCII